MLQEKKKTQRANNVINEKRYFFFIACASKINLFADKKNMGLKYKNYSHRLADKVQNIIC